MANTFGVKTMGLKDVGKLLARERSGLRDVYCPLSKTSVEIWDPLGPLSDRYRFRIDSLTEVEPTETALRQLCNRAGIPYPFMDRLPASLGLGVLRGLTNILMESGDKQHLFRLRDFHGRTMLRAILPSSFVRFDDRDAFHEVSTLTEPTGARALDVYITEDLFRLRLVFPDRLNLGSGSKPDQAFVGIDVKSSETGWCATQVRQAMIRVVCCNGMTSMTPEPGSRKLRRMGIDREEFLTAFEKTLGTVFGSAREIAERLAGSRSLYVRDPLNEVKRVFTRYDLGRPTGRRGQLVQQELLPQLSLLGVSRFDVVQAFTSVAQRLRPEKQEQFEDAMWDYVSKN